MKNKDFRPFSDNPIMIGYDSRLFVEDSELGYAFPEGRLVGENQFISLEDKINEMKSQGESKFRILHIGDSSTSGWNSDNVFKGTKQPHIALYSYKTYSDILSENFDVLSINAGVPGYTTYQAKKYLPRILKQLSLNGIWVDYVTIHLGNNDCTFNGLEDKVRLDNKIPSENVTLMRVSEIDFIKNFTEIIDTVKDYCAQPIILIPASHYFWQPGLRSKKYPEELNEQRNKITQSKVRQLFEESERYYREEKYKIALEKDLLLPRIKEKYKKLLISFALKNQLKYLDLQTLVDSEDDFIDYCHPSEKLNNRIAKVIDSFFKEKNAMRDKSIVGYHLSHDTYTLY